MKKIFFCVSITLSVLYCNAQIEVVKMVGKGSSDYNIGFGAALKFNIPVSEASSASVEGSVVFCSVKESDFTQGIVFVPIKLGYRYTLNGSGSGFYVEPQAGYCVAGALTNDYVDQKVSGFDWAIGAGYLFQPGRRSQYEIGLRYETVYFKGGPGSFIALRLSSNFSFKSRDSD